LARGGGEGEGMSKGKKADVGGEEERKGALREEERRGEWARREGGERREGGAGKERMSGLEEGGGERCSVEKEGKKRGLTMEIVEESREEEKRAEERGREV